MRKLAGNKSDHSINKFILYPFKGENTSKNRNCMILNNILNLAVPEKEITVEHCIHFDVMTTKFAAAKK